MYIVEIGILYNQAPLVNVGFYRKNEVLSDRIKNQIFLAIFNMFSEIFRDNLRKLKMDDYTVLFYGFNPRDDGELENKGDARDNLALNYTIVDLENDRLSPEFLEIVETKMVALSETFKKAISEDEKFITSSDEDFDNFRGAIVNIFKDLLKTPEERFKSLWKK
ncbi:MAG: hypothetical protein ACFFCS_14515 [Candidatus Hodarchaeota archaeon]